MKSKYKKYWNQAMPLALAFVFILPSNVLAAEKYTIDPVHSVVLFKVKHLGIGNFYGRFNDISGSLVVDKNNPGNSSITLEIKSNSVDTNDAKRDQHLRNADFLNAKQFPVISFRSTKVQKLAAEQGKISGLLTLHGTTKTVTATVTKIGEGKDPWGKYRIGLEAKFQFKRSDFGIKYMLPGLSDEIQVTVAVEGIK